MAGTSASVARSGSSIVRVRSVVPDTDGVEFDITKLDAFDVTRMDEFQGVEERLGVAIRSGGLIVLGLTLAGGAVLFAVFEAPIFATIAVGVAAAMTLFGAVRWALAYSRSRPPLDAPSKSNPQTEESALPSTNVD